MIGKSDAGEPPRGWRRPIDPTLRIGDSERNDVAEALSQHFSDGRLDQTELKERLDRAMSAKTGADLQGLLSDLPPLGDETPPPVPHHRRAVARSWALVAVVFLALVALPWYAGPWMWMPRVPWILVGVVVFLIWRRSRRRRWRHEMVS